MPDISSQRVLVTGGTGFVGSHLVERLVALGSDVTIFSRATSDRYRVETIKDKVTLVDVDIADDIAVREAMGRINPETVFHLAAAGVHDPYIKDEIALRINVTGTINVLRAAYNNGVKRIINTGTSYEYGNEADAGGMDPISVYAASKAAAWAFVKMYHRTENWPVVTLRLFQVYGPGQLHTLVPSAIRAGMAEETFATTAGEQLRDWVYIDDVIDAYIKAANAPDVIGEAIDICSGDGTSVREVIDAIFAHFPKVEPQIGALPYRSGETWNLVGSPERAADLLGWQPKTSLVDGIEKTISYYTQKGRVREARKTDHTRSRAMELRAEILDKVGDYYRLEHAPKDWNPGKSKVQYAGRVFNEREMRNMADAVLEFWLTAGRWSQEFEKRFGDFLGVREVIPVNSGSSANLVAMSTLCSKQLRGRTLEAGDEVITTAVAFPTTLAPILQNDLVPVLVDSEMGTYNIDVEQLEAALSEKTRALFITHTLGNPVEMDKLMAFAREHDLYVIEDNCDALGSRFDGQYTGTFGDLATSSFYPAHHITMGEGGAVYTGSPRMAKIARTIRDWGRDCWCGYINPPNGRCGKRFEWEVDGIEGHYDHRYLYTEIGYNLKVTDAQAAVGVAQLDKLPDFVAARKRNFDILYEGLKPFTEYMHLPTWSAKADPSWFAFPITLKEGLPFSRNDLQRFLEGRRIETRLLFAGNILKQPAYRDIPRRVIGDLPIANGIMQNTMFFGLYPGLARPQLEYIIEAFYDIAGEYGLPISQSITSV